MTTSFEEYKRSVWAAPSEAAVQRVVEQTWEAFLQQPEALVGVLLQAGRDNDRDYVGFALGRHIPPAPLFSMLSAYLGHDQVVEAFVATCQPFVRAPLTVAALEQQRAMRGLAVDDVPPAFRPASGTRDAHDGTVATAPLATVAIDSMLDVARLPWYPGDGFIMTAWALLERADLRSSPEFWAACTMCAVLGLPSLVELCVARAGGVVPAVLAIVEHSPLPSSDITAREFARLAGVRPAGDNADADGFVLWVGTLRDMSRAVRGRSDAATAWVESERAAARRAAVVSDLLDVLPLLAEDIAATEQAAIDDFARSMAHARARAA
jgi:hypothetical protein